MDVKGVSFTFMDVKGVLFRSSPKCWIFVIKEENGLSAIRGRGARRDGSANKLSNIHNILTTSFTQDLTPGYMEQ